MIAILLVIIALIISGKRFVSKKVKLERLSSK